MHSYSVEFTIRARVEYTPEQYDNLRRRAVDSGATQVFIIAQDARFLINRQRSTGDKLSKLIGLQAPGQGRKVQPA